MNKISALVLLFAALAVQAKFIPEIQDAIVRHPELLKHHPGAKVDAASRENGGRIINGTEATKGQFPYQCHLLVTDESGGSFFCGCSVISDSWILTAAHCADNTTVSFTVTMGDTDRSAQEGTEVVRETSTKIGHPEWRPRVITNDIALLRIEPVTLGNGIERVCLAKNDSSNFAGRIATVSGWGKTDNLGGASTKLNYAQVPVITNVQCRAAFPIAVSESNICTSTADLKGTCNGDSGGPLVVTENGQPLQIGIVSFGSGAGCTAEPSVYTRMSSFEGWILENVGEGAVNVGC